MRIGEFCRLRRDDQIAGQRELERAGIAMAMHRRDNRLRQVGEALDSLGLEVGVRRTLTFRDVGEIVARGKTFSRAAHNDQADPLGFVRDPVNMIAQLDEHLDVE